ncbi:hypothetical protein THAOC_30510 [Thalassiosira oceanica]|uniref:Uncharacterized protein n=1 Tax=Thalassiosira oceanica TaxID=159749 RepID=K0RBA0_THAOC|nr:hypothetical protein THAOC_30510 [Thalassiosira oceanica]|eukprot:EJK50500.1 hypothetical protein THAOC_30510 [Thalassiosira oceanica]
MGQLIEDLPAKARKDNMSRVEDRGQAGTPPGTRLYWRPRQTTFGPSIRYLWAVNTPGLAAADYLETVPRLIIYFSIKGDPLFSPKTIFGYLVTTS